MHLAHSLDFGFYRASGMALVFIVIAALSKGGYNRDDREAAQNGVDVARLRQRRVPIWLFGFLIVTQMMNAVDYFLKAVGFSSHSTLRTVVPVMDIVFLAIGVVLIIRLVWLTRRQTH